MPACQMPWTISRAFIALDRSRPARDPRRWRRANPRPRCGSPLVSGEPVDRLVIGIGLGGPAGPARGAVRRGGVVVDEDGKGGGLAREEAGLAAVPDEFDPPGPWR